MKKEEPITIKINPDSIVSNDAYDIVKVKPLDSLTIYCKHVYLHTDVVSFDFDTTCDIKNFKLIIINGTTFKQVENNE